MPQKNFSRASAKALTVAVMSLIMVSAAWAAPKYKGPTRLWIWQRRRRPLGQLGFRRPRKFVRHDQRRRSLWRRYGLRGDPRIERPVE
jgi:hypothetical protein